MNFTITLTVNGKQKTIDVDSESSLLDAIRGDMFRSCVKLRCGKGRCGGCVVLLDGQRVLACDVPVSQAHGRRVETIQ